MNTRTIILTCSLTFTIAVLIGMYYYGPSRRIFVVPNRVHQVAAPPEILEEWEAAGIKGRIAVVFTRRLNASEPNTDWAEKQYLQQAMHRGIVRKVFHVVPDASWGEISRNLAGHRITSAGILLLYDEGRVLVTPLSKFRQYYRTIGEKVLAVLEPTIWTAPEWTEINALVNSSPLSTDMLTLLESKAAASGVMPQASAK